MPLSEPADISGDYRHPPAEALIFDVATQVMSAELAGFLTGWLGLAPGEYVPADLQTAAAVLVDRLGLRDGGSRWYRRIIAHKLAQDQEGPA